MKKKKSMLSMVMDDNSDALGCGMIATIKSYHT